MILYVSEKLVNGISSIWLLFMGFLCELRRAPMIVIVFYGEIINSVENSKTQNS